MRKSCVMVKIFEDDDSAEGILNHLLEHGIAGIAGGRMTTESKLLEVRSLAEYTQHPEIVAVATLHHFWGTLAFPYDSEIYLFDEAKRAVEEAWDKQLAEQGIFPDTLT